MKLKQFDNNCDLVSSSKALTCIFEPTPKSSVGVAHYRKLKREFFLIYRNLPQLCWIKRPLGFHFIGLFD